MDCGVLGWEWEGFIDGLVGIFNYFLIGGLRE